MKINQTIFGTSQQNETVHAIQLVNDKGMCATVLSYGGVITEISVPDKNGVVENVVLGYSTLQPYETFSPHFGALTGRVAGRISDGVFTIDGTTYHLAKNNFQACLHGGIRGFAFQTYAFETRTDANACSVILKRVSPHMEEGFPGDLALEATYTLNNDNELSIEYHATTNRTTPVTLTNHSYFNLSGKPGTRVHDHLLTIQADHYGQIDEETVPTQIACVDNTPFDFRKARNIGSALKEDHEQLRFGKGFDHPFRLHDAKPQIILADPKSGRKMEIETTEKNAVVYSGNFLGELPDEPLSNGSMPQDYAGICFETQAFPDAIHHPEVESILLEPGQIYQSKTIYRFGIQA